jgi:hypothetical protein
MCFVVTIVVCAQDPAGGNAVVEKRHGHVLEGAIDSVSKFKVPVRDGDVHKHLSSLQHWSAQLQADRQL